MDKSRRQFLGAVGLLPVSTSLIGSRKVRAETTVPTDDEISAAAAEQRIEVEARMGNMLRELPEEESERVDLVDEASTKSCERISDFGVDVDEIETGTLIAESTLEVLEKALGHIDEVLGTSLPVEYLDEVSRLTKFVPLLSSLQNYSEVCCDIYEVETREKIKEKMEEFYLAVALIIVELILLPSSVGYRTAFVGTRYTANVGLVRIRQIIGLRGYSVVLSTVHWAYRGTIEGVVAYIVGKTAETLEEVEDIDLPEIEESDLEFDFLEEDDDLLSRWLDERDGRSQFLENWDSLDDLDILGTESQSGENDGSPWFW